MKYKKGDGDLRDTGEDLLKKHGLLICFGKQ